MFCILGSVISSGYSLDIGNPLNFWTQIFILISQSLLCHCKYQHYLFLIIFLLILFSSLKIPVSTCIYLMALFRIFFLKRFWGCVQSFSLYFMWSPEAANHSPVFSVMLVFLIVLMCLSSNLALNVLFHFFL